MEIIWLYRAIILLILLLFSALYSGSEVALFSLDEKKLEAFDGKTGIIGKYITKLLKYPRKLLVTILIGNTLSNVAASIISVYLALDIAKMYNLSVD
ncbi:MAG: DUF21 domain-containing protein, partial [Melioribacteraceae bacterium]|nr:DUF21 domain-containing protein [Melioribacteraceae bacterium]